MSFEFATAGRIIFGSGKLDTVGDIASGMGERALVVWGCPPEIHYRLRDLLAQHGISCIDINIAHEPTIEAVNDGLSIAREISPDMVIGIGGGSTLDTAKTLAALITNPGDLQNYLEVVGNGQPLARPPLPLIAIPTTAGTGAEVTRNAVIELSMTHTKVSLRSPYLLPRIALVDPALTISLPASVTAYTGLDALTQLIEPYMSNNSNPLTDAICEKGLSYVGQSLRKVYDDGKDLLAREQMALASLFSGLALANSKLGAVHGLAGPIGGMISAPHGAICASLLPNVLKANIQAILQRAPGHPVMERYTQIARILTGKQDATAEEGIGWIMDICSHLNIRPLSSFGFTEADFSQIIGNAQNASSMKGNPIILFEDELRSILRGSL